MTTRRAGDDWRGWSSATTVRRTAGTMIAYLRAPRPSLGRLHRTTPGTPSHGRLNLDLLEAHDPAILPAQQQTIRHAADDSVPRLLDGIEHPRTLSDKKAIPRGLTRSRCAIHRFRREAWESIAVIAHLKGRERALEAFGLTGRRAEWIALASLHGGVFTRAQLADWLGASRYKVLRLVQALTERRLLAEDGRGLEGLPGLRSRRLPRARCRGCPPPQDHLDRSGRSPPALVRLRHRASEPALAADRVGEGRRVRGARHRPRPDARPGLPGRGRGGAALLPARDARGAGLPPRRVRPRRSRLRHLDGDPLVAGSAPEALGGVAGGWLCRSRPSGSRAPGDRSTGRGRSSRTGPVRTRPRVPCIRPGPSPRRGARSRASRAPSSAWTTRRLRKWAAFRPASAGSPSCGNYSVRHVPRARSTPIRCGGRAAFPESGFERRPGEPVADPEVRKRHRGACAGKSRPSVRNAGSASRRTAWCWATARGSPVPIRVSGPWTGATPPFGMPGAA